MQNPRRTLRHDGRQRLDARVREHRVGIGARRLVAEQFAGVGGEEFAQALHQDRRGVFAAHRQHVLAGYFRLQIAAAQNRVEVALDIVGRALLDHQDRALARQNATISSSIRG